MTFVYGYDKYIDVTVEQILTKVTQEQIFNIILREPIIFGKQYKSPLRTDKHAGARFEKMSDGIIIFIDFGDKTTHRTCFKFIMDGYKLTTLSAVISKLIQHFNLPEEANQYESIVTPSIIQYDKDNYEPRTKIVDIEYVKKDYSKRDIFYWNSHITKVDQLLADNVFCASRITIHNSERNSKSSFSPFGLCYIIDFFDAIKIYQPYSVNYKFITNCNENHIGNIDNLPPTGDKLVVCKAYKDHRIFRNLNLGSSYNFIWFHNEGVIPSLDRLVNLASRFNEIIFFYDNDYRGISAAYKLVKYMNSIRKGCSIMKYIPLRYVYKDIGEFIYKEGRTDTVKFLNKIRL